MSSRDINPHNKWYKLFYSISFCKVWKRIALCGQFEMFWRSFCRLFLLNCFNGPQRASYFENQLWPTMAGCDGRRILTDSYSKSASVVRGFSFDQLKIDTTSNRSFRSWWWPKKVSDTLNFSADSLTKRSSFTRTRKRRLQLNAAHQRTGRGWRWNQSCSSL